MGFTERSDFSGEGLEKPIYWARLPKKRGGYKKFVCLRGGLEKKEWMVFLKGVDTPVPTMIILSHMELSRIDLLFSSRGFLFVFL